MAASVEPYRALACSSAAGAGLRRLGDLVVVMGVVPFGCQRTLRWSWARDWLGSGGRRPQRVSGSESSMGSSSHASYHQYPPSDEHWSSLPYRMTATVSPSVATWWDSPTIHDTFVSTGMMHSSSSSECPTTTPSTVQ